MGTTACDFQGCLALAIARARFRSACDFPSPGAGCLQFPCKTAIWFLPEVGWHGNRMRTECRVAGNGAAHSFCPDLQNRMQQDLGHFLITKIPVGRGESMRCAELDRRECLKREEQKIGRGLVPDAETLQHYFTNHSNATRNGNNLQRVAKTKELETILNRRPLRGGDLPRASATQYIRGCFTEPQHLLIY